MKIKVFVKIGILEMIKFKKELKLLKFIQFIKINLAALSKPRTYSIHQQAIFKPTSIRLKKTLTDKNFYLFF